VAPGGYICRRAGPADRQAILALCRTSLGWSSADPDEAFFAWKHDDNPFGRSPSWVAEAGDGSLIGLRVFLRWGFRDQKGRAVAAVRAVDTATHPDWRGQGVFSKLTLDALPDLAADGIDFVFNTPNDKSRPGYLKMGWSDVGKLPVAARLGSVGSLRRLRGARTGAELWSQPVTVGDPATEAFADRGAVAALLDRARRPVRLATDRSPAFLSWRYRFGPLHYRVWRLGSSLSDGVIVFRVRRRGAALEIAICDVLAPPRTRLRAPLRDIVRRVGADYMIAATSSVGLTAGFLPAVGLGPVVTWKPINRTGVPVMKDLELVLGDIELF